jgi:hypothetical protein
MWSYLTRSFINRLPGYVENKAATPKRFKPRRNRVVLAGFDNIAGFVRTRFTVRRVTVWRGWIGLGTLERIKQSFFHAASRVGGDLGESVADVVPPQSL